MSTKIEKCLQDGIDDIFSHNFPGSNFWAVETTASYLSSSAMGLPIVSSPRDNDDSVASVTAVCTDCIGAPGNLKDVVRTSRA